MDNNLCYAVYVNGARVTGRALSFEEATGVANLWRSKGFQEVLVDIVEREFSER